MCPDSFVGHFSHVVFLLNCVVYSAYSRGHPSHLETDFHTSLRPTRISAWLKPILKFKLKSHIVTHIHDSQKLTVIVHSIRKMSNLLLELYSR